MMKLHHLRNATFIIESGAHHILVDPMLGPKGSLPPFSFVRHKARRNPLVPLPKNADPLLDRVTLCLITHSQKWGVEPLTHTDHLDKPGKSFLVNNQIPVICQSGDRTYLERQGIKVAAPLEYWEETGFSGGKITAIPARHGHGWYHHLMANGAGLLQTIWMP